MSIGYETVDVISKATFAYTWDGEILTMTVDAGTYVGTHFWRKLNNSVIELQPPEPQLPLETEPLPFAEFVSAIPANGSEIATNAVITLVFSSDPGDVVSSAGVVAGGGKARHIAGPFPGGALVLTIAWTNGDGSHTLGYTVVFPDVTAPVVTGGTVSDGDEDVDPAEINDGGIEITFSEEVTGNIALQTEAGDDVGWLGSVGGNKATLELVAGKQIRNKTTYIIKGKVSDAAGNQTDILIIFITR